MNNTKKVGRPKKFDRSDALSKAVNIFWKKGYDGASMKDLTRAMGINGPSLYAEFGNKETLFRLSLDHYASSNGCAPLLAFETTENIKDAVTAFFEAAILYASNHESGNKGCFMASSAATVSGCVTGVATMLRKSIEQTDMQIAQRFKLEVEKGNLPKDFPCLARAKLMFDLRQGLVLRARAAVPTEDLRKDLTYKTEIVLGAV